VRLFGLVASFGFRMYLLFNNYSASYSSLGAVMILVWLYVAGLAYLIGAEINAEIERGTRGTLE
jgi:membrane protein